MERAKHVTSTFRALWVRREHCECVVSRECAESVLSLGARREFGGENNTDHSSLGLQVDCIQQITPLKPALFCVQLGNDVTTSIEGRGIVATQIHTGEIKHITENDVLSSSVCPHRCIHRVSVTYRYRIRIRYGYTAFGANPSSSHHPYSLREAAVMAKSSANALFIFLLALFILSQETQAAHHSSPAPEPAAHEQGQALPMNVRGGAVAGARQRRTKSRACSSARSVALPASACRRELTGISNSAPVITTGKLEEGDQNVLELIISSTINFLKLGASKERRGGGIFRFLSWPGGYVLGGRRLKPNTGIVPVPPFEVLAS
ncbi:hypothetical protein KSP39_PZI017567 [Platanthera zijinensis]|uniref:Uncharacterized protein n=1 Tax=Platanthera zijinensis TaxID=2320716 RepID=A0AAP0G058_9ASPA